MKSLGRRDENFTIRYAWRLLILGAIGLIHHALWRGDILSIYALLGFILLFLRKLDNRWLLLLGVLLISNIPTRVYDAVWLIGHPGKPIEEFSNAEADHYYAIVKDAPFMEMVKDNWKALDYKVNYQLTTGRAIITLGFFFLGMFVGRQQWFQNLDGVKPLLRKICKVTGIGFAVLLIIGIAVFVTDNALNLQFQKSPWSDLFFGMLFDFFNAGMTIFYVAGLTLMMYKSRWQKLLYPLASVGKMALTSYLMQTLFGLLLFYSFGLRLFAVTSPAVNALLTLVIFIVQAAFCKWWLRYFNYGPVEWLWRSLTFFRFQPMIRRPMLVNPVD